MVDLGPALEAFSRRRSHCPHAGTRWEHSKKLQTNNDPAVPHVPDAEDVIERAAFLEFCEGLDRSTADAMALAEFGFQSWDELGWIENAFSDCVPLHNDTHAQREGAH